MARARFVVAMALAACGGEAAPGPEPAEPVRLAPEAWALVPADADPFDDRPADAACGAGGFGPELGVFEVETDICRYLTVAQPLPADLPAGATLEGAFWHLGLFAPEPTEAHVELRVGPHRLLEARPPVPGPEGIHSVEWTAPARVAAGTLAYFHVHNHGYNSYRLGPIEAKTR